MPLPVASDILRRLQNTIYQPWEDNTQPTATRDSSNDNNNNNNHASSPSMGHGDVESNTNHSNEHQVPHDLHSFNFGGGHGAVSRSDPSSPPPQSSSPSSPSSFENLYPRPASEMSTRRRQPSNPAASTPDVNAQSLLRKRILEIQSFALPEREKARLVQVHLRLNLKSYSQSKIRP
jgi:hypothetical protein